MKIDDLRDEAELLARMSRYGKAESITLTGEFAHSLARAILALLDSPVGEPEPDVLREAEAVMRSACILLTDDLQRGDGVLTVEKVREAYTLLFDFLHTDIDRRSKLPGAGINEPPPDHERS